MFLTRVLLSSFIIITNLYAGIDINYVDWSSLTRQQKIHLIQDIKIFVQNYENTHKSKLADKKFSYFQKVMNPFYAHAADSYDCLYGGWPSTRSSQGLCKWPQSANPKYQSYQNKCGESELHCNPMLFGEGLCIDFSSLRQRRLAYSQCESKFKETDRDLDQIVNNISDQDFNELKKVIDDVCNNPEVGTQHVTPMCAGLKNKMAKYIPNTFPSGLSYGASDKMGAAAKQEYLNKLMDQLETNLQKFSSECREPIPDSQLIECQNLANLIEQDELMVNKLLAELESEMGTEAFCNAYPEYIEVSENIFLADSAVSQVQCTQSDKDQYKKNCNKDILCFGASSLAGIGTLALDAFNIETGDCINSENSCAAQAITGLIDALWSTVTGIWDLIKMGASWVKDQWNSFWNDTAAVEDKTSDTALIVSNLSNQDVEEIKEDKEGWLSRTVNNLWGGIKEWLATDIYCQDWSGAPRYSTCLKPFSWDCMSCSTLLKGSCALIGAVSSELVLAYFTGGASTAAKFGAKSAAKLLKGSKGLSRAVEKASPLIKTPIAAMAKGGKWVTKTKLVKNSSRFTAKQMKETHQLLKTRLAGIKNTSNYDNFSKVSSNLYKYSGAKAFVYANEKAFKLGQKHAEWLFTRGRKPSTALSTTVNQSTRVGKANNIVTKNAEETIDLDIIGVDADGIPIYGNASSVSKSTKKQLALPPSKVEKIRSRSVYKDIGSDPTKIKALDQFVSQVEMTDEVARLMDEAHLAPYGYL
jgi:hypothetical protein